MNFDRLAPHYDWLETFTAGEKLQQVRTAWLQELRGCRRILSVGEGHGRFAEACAKRFPGAQLTCVEASPRMLARAQQRIGAAAPRIQWQCADVLAWTPPREKYDAIVTCFFLDCFPPDQLAAVIAKLAACAAPDAVWLVSDFAVPPQGLAHWRARAVHALMYGFFGMTVGLPARRLTPPDESLCAQAFRLEARRESEWGLLRSDWWQREPT
ncbi:MAG: class I SAM-dependent methyltransferase [bacterium]|nr:class I SAM-dependent methyltransferase [bacterium]MDI1334963.1 class I SAM-dependent methyltransferase [Lacunisphaera sp.]